LNDGAIVIYPSDTVYGLLSGTDPLSVDRLRGIKGSSAERPFILLVSGLEMAETLADCSDPEIRGIMQTRWPGRLTLVLPALENCPRCVTAEDGTVALRHPAHRFSNMILSRYGHPLVSTSANVSGGENCLDFKRIPPSLLREADLAVDSGTLPFSKPSTILKLIRSRGRA
jgi:tRNA threonylcarbamoyl adenosine modification protein (Sua5/YciO/YrdC/YwlC family)